MKTQDKLYMNPQTGSIDTYDGWWYENEDGERVNAVDEGEVVEADSDGCGGYRMAGGVDRCQIIYLLDHIDLADYTIIKSKQYTSYDQELDVRITAHNGGWEVIKFKCCPCDSTTSINLNGWDYYSFDDVRKEIEKIIANIEPEEDEQ